MDPSKSSLDEEPGGARAAALTALERAASLVTWGGITLGVLRGGRFVSEAFLDRWDARLWFLASLDGLFLAASWALAGCTAGALLRALGNWMLLSYRQTMPVAGSPVLPAAGFGPHAEPREPAAPERTAIAQLRDQALAEIRRSIRAGEWDEARDTLAALAADGMDDDRLDVLRGELQSAREAARDDRLAELEAARSVNDPDRVLELHRILVPLLDTEARSALDSELAGWFLRLVHNRLRTGRIQAELAHLASRIAEEFRHTVEGASLRAALPTLRRSAGLCSRCAGPYTGVADACPACLSQPQAPVPARPPIPASSDGHDSSQNAST
jgi:hypothetical protein